MSSLVNAETAILRPTLLNNMINLTGEVIKMNEKEVENETLPITEDELITLIMNANSLTAGLDAIESMAINFESDNKKEIKQANKIAGLIAGMKELAGKNARMLSDIEL